MPWQGVQDRQALMQQGSARTYAPDSSVVRQTSNSTVAGLPMATAPSGVSCLRRCPKFSALLVSAQVRISVYLRHAHSTLSQPEMSLLSTPVSEGLLWAHACCTKAVVLLLLMQWHPAHRGETFSKQKPSCWLYMPEAAARSL